MRWQTLCGTRMLIFYISVLLCVIGSLGRTVTGTSRNDCKPRWFPGSSSFTCVCSSAYCDTVEDYEPLKKGTFVVYTTTQLGADRLSKRVYDIDRRSNASDVSLTFTINATARYQNMTGFGGAFTDAAGYNILNLSQPAQDNLLKSYFHPSGIEYTFGRLPIASCDFSLRVYSYDEKNRDFDMKHFNLTDEDFRYKIPLVKRSQSMSRRPIKLIASPWSAPAWMKDNNKMTGGGKLKGPPAGDYYKAYASYLTKFLDEYSKENLTFWGLSMLNEPSAGLAYNYSFQSMLFTAENERDFAKLLGPMLHSKGYQDVNLIMLDDQRLFLPLWAQSILSDPIAAKYVSGIGVHWYRDDLSPINKLNETHHDFPDKFLLYTESSNGYEFWDTAVLLGDWGRGESYSEDILWDVNNWVTGWIDWNLALNKDGGPNWAKNFVDSSIIVNAEEDEFYKQPMFYHIGHFSKFIVPGSFRIGFLCDKDAFVLLPSAAFLLPNGQRAAVLLNKQGDPVNVTIKDDKNGGYINAQIPPKAIQTYIWN